MIIINDENVIDNKKDLLLFFKYMDGEVYDDVSRQVNDVIQDYLSELFDKMELINMSVHDRISEDIDVFAIVELSLVADYTKTELQCFSKKEDLKIKKRDEVVFNGIAERYLKDLKPLWDRFLEIDVE